jgi:hypothetical protein
MATNGIRSVSDAGTACACGVSYTCACGSFWRRFLMTLPMDGTPSFPSLGDRNRGQGRNPMPHNQRRRYYEWPVPRNKLKDSPASPFSQFFSPSGRSSPRQPNPEKLRFPRNPSCVSLEADAQKLDPPAPTDGPSFLVVEHLYDRLVEFADEGTGVVPRPRAVLGIHPRRPQVDVPPARRDVLRRLPPLLSEAVKFTFERIINTDHPQHFPRHRLDDRLARRLVHEH